MNPLDRIADRLQAFAAFQDRPGATAELEAIAAEVRALAHPAATTERDDPGPSARNPWTVTLCWTPTQNHGAVSTLTARAPVTAIVGLLHAGVSIPQVAAEFGIPEQAVHVLHHLIDDLAPEESA